MATAENANDYAISSDAMGVIDCFSNGMDQVVYKMAGRIAAERESSPDGIVITIPDIEKAVTNFAETMNRSELSDDIKESISSMLDCCSLRIQNAK